MNKCKGCGYEGEFKFCPQCGKKHIESSEERIDRLETEITRLRALVLDILKQRTQERVTKAVSTLKHKPTKKDWILGKRTRPETLQKKIKIVKEYVWTHPNKELTLSGICKSIKGFGYGGIIAVELREHFLNNKEYGIVVTRKTPLGKWISLSSSKGKYKSTGSNKTEDKRAPVLRELARIRIEVIRQNPNWDYKTASIEAGRIFSERKRGTPSGSTGYMIRNKPVVKANYEDRCISEANKSVLAQEQVTDRVDYSHNFPSINGLDIKFNGVLVGIVKNAIKNKGDITDIDLQFAGIGYNDLPAFFEDFMVKSNDISKSLGIPNLFKISGIGKNRIISYG
jgi:hypothetical protein